MCAWYGHFVLLVATRPTARDAGAACASRTYRSNRLWAGRLRKGARQHRTLLAARCVVADGYSQFVCASPVRRTTTRSSSMLLVGVQPSLISSRPFSSLRAREGVKHKRDRSERLLSESLAPLTRPRCCAISQARERATSSSWSPEDERIFDETNIYSCLLV